MSKRLSGDQGQVQVLEAVLVGILILATVLFVLSFSLPSSPTSKTRAELELRSSDALNVVHELPATDWKYGDNTLSKYVAQSIQGDSTNLTSKLNNLLGVGSIYSVYIDNGYEPFEIYKKRDPLGETVTGSRIITPQWSYDLVVPDLNFYDGLAEMGVYSLPVKSSKVEEMRGELLNITLAGAGLPMIKQHEITAEGSTLAPVHSSELLFTKNQNPPHIPQGFRKISVTELSTTSSVPITFFIRLRETQDGTLPNGSTLTVMLPPDWDDALPDDVTNSQYNWAAAKVTGNSDLGWNITANRTLPLVNDTRIFKFSTAIYTTKATKHFYEFSAFLGNGSLGRARFIVEMPAGVGAASLRPLVSTAVPYPLGVNAQTTFTAGFANGIADVNLGRFSVSSINNRSLFAGVIGLTPSAKFDPNVAVLNASRAFAATGIDRENFWLIGGERAGYVTADITRVNATMFQSNATFRLPVNLSHMAYAQTESDGSTLLYGGKLLSGYSPYVYNVLPHSGDSPGEVLNLSADFTTYVNTTALSSDFESSPGWTFASQSDTYSGAPGVDGGLVTTQAHGGSKSYKINLAGNQSNGNRTFIYRSVTVTPNVPTLVSAWIYDAYDPAGVLNKKYLRQYLQIDGDTKDRHDPWKGNGTAATGWLQLSTMVVPTASTINVSVGVSTMNDWFGATLDYDAMTTTYVDDVTVVQHSLPPARAGASAAFDARDQILYVFGGYNGTQFFSDIMKIDLPNQKITLAGSLPSARANTSAMWDPITRRAYTFGGHDGTNYLNTTVIYDADTSIVSAPASANLPWPIAGALLLNDEQFREAYLFGGLNSGGYNSSITKFHSETERFMVETQRVVVTPTAFAQGGFPAGNSSARILGGITTGPTAVHTGTKFTTSGWHLFNATRVYWTGARSVTKTTAAEFIFNVTANGYATGLQNDSYAFTPVTFDNSYQTTLDRFSASPSVYYRDIPPDKVNSTSGALMSTGYKARDSTTKLVINNTFNVTSSLLLGKKAVAGKTTYDANGVSTSTLVGTLRSALYNSTMDVERRYYTLGGNVNITVRAQSLVDQLSGLGALNIIETTRIYGPASLDSGVPIKTLVGAYAEGTVSALSKVNIINSNGAGANDVVVGSKTGVVYAIDGDGAHPQLWQKGVASQVTAMASGRLSLTNYGTVVGTCDGALYALAGSSGDTVWSYRFNYSVNAIALHDNEGDGIIDYVYAGAGGTCQNSTVYDGQLAKFTSAGTLQWAKQLLIPIGSMALGAVGNHTGSATWARSGGLVIQGLDGTVAGFTFEGEGKWTYTPTGVPRRNVTYGGTPVASTAALDGPKPPIVVPKVVQSDLNGDGISDYLTLAPTSKVRAYNGISAGNVFSGVLSSGFVATTVYDAAFIDEDRGLIVGDSGGTGILAPVVRGTPPSSYIIINASKTLRLTSVTYPTTSFFAIAGVAGGVTEESFGTDPLELGDGLVWVCDNRGIEDPRCIDALANTMDGSNFTLFPKTPIHAIQFVNATTGYWAGHNAVYKTNDRGVTWTNVTPTPPSVAGGYSFISVHFVSDTLGFVVGEDGYVFKTTDGATTWSSLQIEAESGKPFGLTLRSVTFANATHGWIGAGGLVEPTEAYCTQVTGSAQFCARVKANLTGNNNTAVADIYYTTNGGTSWSRGWVEGLNEVVNSVSFSNGTHGWAVGTNSRLWRTVDGGLNWHSEPSPGINNWTVVVTPGANYTYVYGGRSSDTSYLMGHSLVASSETLRSKKVGSFAGLETIANVFIEVPKDEWIPYFVPASGSTTAPITLEVSNDGGATWVTVTGNNSVIKTITFGTLGNDLRWRMTLATNALGLSIAPRDYYLNLSYNGTLGSSAVYREDFSSTTNYDVSVSGAEWNTTLKSARLQTYGDLWSWDVQSIYGTNATLVSNTSSQVHDIDSSVDFTGDGVNETLFDVGAEVYVVDGRKGTKAQVLDGALLEPDAVPYIIRSFADGVNTRVLIVALNDSTDATPGYRITLYQTTTVAGQPIFGCGLTFAGAPAQINDVVIGELVTSNVGLEVAVAREDGAVAVYSADPCGGTGDPLWTKTPQAIPGNYRHSWTIPQNSFFGAYPVITEISWTQVVGVSIAGSARLVDYFVVTLPDGTVAENPAYNVKLVAWFEDWG